MFFFALGKKGRDSWVVFKKSVYLYRNWQYINVIPTYDFNNFSSWRTYIKEHTEHTHPLAKIKLNAETMLSLSDALKESGSNYIPE